MHGLIKDLTGKRFGRLVVTSVTDKRYRKKNIIWLCKCDCGNEKEVVGNSLTSGRTQSCGCLQRQRAVEAGHKNAIGVGESSFNTLFSLYKHRAKKKGLDFSMSEESFRFLTKQSCVYCGRQPEQSLANRNPTGSYVYNGIDRLDSSLGYIDGNVVSCCGKCNMAKGSMSVEEFLWLISDIYKYRKIGDTNDFST